MNDQSAPKSVFGPVVVLSKKPSGTGTTVAVKLRQTVQTTYPPGSRPHLKLHDAISQVDKEDTVVSHRQATQRLLPAEADRLSPGDEVGGHLVRKLTSKPRYAGQKQAYEGGYASSSWVPSYEEDVDLRETT